MTNKELFRIDSKADAAIKAQCASLLRLLKTKTGDVRLDKHIRRLEGL